jgi:hypothetical protein
MTNPAAGVDLTGWTGSTVTPVRATGLAGLPRTTGVKSTGGGFFRTPTIPCSPGEQFAASFYMLNNSGFSQSPHTVYISYTTSGHGEQFPETFATTTVADGSSIRASAVADVSKVPADATGIFLIIDSMPANITITAVLMERAASVGSYFDGSFADCTWDGATDLSASTFDDTPVGPTGPALSVWNGSSEVGATLSVWTGSAEVPAVLDSVV